MKRQGRLISLLLTLAVLGGLVLLGCPNPTSNDTNDDGGGTVTDTPIIFTDFESGLGNWAGNGGATAEVSTEQLKNGSQSCKVITGDAGWKSVWMYNLGNIILNDISYDYSVWIYQATGADVKFSITIKDSNGGYNSVIYQTVVPSEQWTEIKAAYILTADKGTADSMYIESDTPSITFYFDDFKVIKTPNL